MSARTVPKTSLDLDVPSLSDTGQARVEFHWSGRRESWYSFNLALSARDSHDNRPPASSNLRNDVGVTLSIGWTF